MLLQDWARQVAKWVHIKTFHCIVAGRHNKNSGQQHFGTKCRRQVSAIQVAHLDIKEHKRRTILAYGPHDLGASATVSHQLDLRIRDYGGMKSLARDTISLPEQCTNSHAQN